MVSIHEDTGCPANTPMPGIVGGGRPDDRLRLDRFIARVLGESAPSVADVSANGEHSGDGCSRDLRRCSLATRNALEGETSTLPCGDPSRFSSTSSRGSSNASEDADDCDNRVLVVCDEVDVPVVDTDDVLCVLV